MKKGKNILSYIVAALSILVTSASSSPAAPAPGIQHVRRAVEEVADRLLGGEGSERRRQRAHDFQPRGE